MFRPLTCSHRRPTRPGMSLLFVLGMLATLTVIGLVFLLYATQKLKVLTAYRDAEMNTGPTTPDPTGTLNLFFSTLIYDTGDDNASLNNSLRGHSVARSIYGGRPGNTVAFNGVGTFHEDLTTLGLPAGLTGDRAQFVNYSLAMFGANPMFDPASTTNQPVLFDP